jgi:hypothetical protein
MLLPAIAVSVLLSISASLPATTGVAEPKSPLAAAAAPARPQQPRVWTNDAIEQLPDAEVSSEADATTPAPQPSPAEELAAQPSLYNPQQDPEHYRELLAPLEAQLASIAEQAALIRTTLADPLRYGSAAVPFGDAAEGRPRLSPENGLLLLESRRLAVEAQMAEIRAQARQNWLAPGVVR